MLGPALQLIPRPPLPRGRGFAASCGSMLQLVRDIPLNLSSWKRSEERGPIAPLPSPERRPNTSLVTAGTKLLDNKDPAHSLVAFLRCVEQGGETVVKRLACSPPTKENRVQSQAGLPLPHLPDFRMWESCRTMIVVIGVCPRFTDTQCRSCLIVIGPFRKRTCLPTETSGHEPKENCTHAIEHWSLAFPDWQTAKLSAVNVAHFVQVKYDEIVTACPSGARRIRSSSRATAKDSCPLRFRPDNLAVIRPLADTRGRLEEYFNPPPPPFSSQMIAISLHHAPEKHQQSVDCRTDPTLASHPQSPAGSQSFRWWESCWTMPLVGGFPRGSPVSPAPSFRRRFIFTSITLIGSEDLDVKGRPNLFTSLDKPLKNHPMYYRDATNAVRYPCFSHTLNMSLSRSGPPVSLARLPPRRTGFNPRPWESCRTMLLAGGFSRGSPVSPSLSFLHCSIIPISTNLIGSQDLAVKSHPNLSTRTLTF
ncbi:hypothetical protein PR048_010493 [Dryococelus australis]|uniref:Uncharacterized protein n=1 Tax=Dryococelus australis TaxID=614101 RepID=A0ABQ9I2V3_9NEOP|nr:hypothetical protein PR048_010493 [Dryococelus australis]